MGRYTGTTDVHWVWSVVERECVSGVTQVSYVSLRNRGYFRRPLLERIPLVKTKSTLLGR